MNANYLRKFSGFAIFEDHKTYTYSDLYTRILYYQNEFTDYSYQNIVVIAEFSFESISLLIALANTLNTVIPIVYTTDEEVENKLSVSKANILIKFENKKIIKKIINLNEINLTTDQGLILFSSGTTGEPKMMLHKYSNLFNFIENKIARQRSLRILLFLMFDHIGGINTLLNCLKDGSTIVIPSERTPEYIVDIIYKHGVNVLPVTPTFLNLMLINHSDYESKLKTIKLISYGTERMPEAILKKIKFKFPGVKLMQTFGTSETGILKTVSKSSDSLFFKIEDSRYEYKIVENVLYIRSNLNVCGYLNADNNKFDNDGWYNTGDIVTTDNEGYLMIVGRVNEVINVGGLKVMPTEVESVILQQKGIIDCLVFGQNNPITGQMVSTKVVIDPDYFAGLSEIEIKQKIKTHCRRLLDKFKIPARVIIVDSIGFTSRFKKNIK